MQTPTQFQNEQAALSFELLRWDDLEPDATSLFHVWTEGSDLRWAESAWGILGEAGLTAYQTELERIQVLVRLIALAAYYHSFCYAAWEEGDVQPAEWASDLDLSPVRVGQLLGSGIELREGLSEHEAVGEAVTELVSREYQGITSALRRAFETEGYFFAFLWLSRDPDLSGRRSLNDDTLDEILNSDVWEKGPAWDWLVTGCPVRLG